jgi:hypothetical protein
MDVDSADAAEEKNLVRFSINGELLLPLQLPVPGPDLPPRIHLIQLSPARSARTHEGGTDAARPPPRRLHAVQVRHPITDPTPLDAHPDLGPAYLLNCAMLP